MLICCVNGPPQLTAGVSGGKSRHFHLSTKGHGRLSAEEYRAKCSTHAAELESAIENLRDSAQLDRMRYSDFWAQAKAVSSLFKELLPLRKTDREQLWTSYRGICDSVGDRQKRERSQLEAESRDKRSYVESDIAEAASWLNAGDSFDNLRKAEEHLTRAKLRMKTGWDEFNYPTYAVKSFTGNAGRMTREDQAACWEAWKDVNETLWNRRRRLAEYAFDRLFEQAQAAEIEAESGDPKAARASVKVVQAELKSVRLDRSQYAVVRDKLDSAWAKANLRSERMREEWRDRTTARLEKLAELQDKNEEYLESLREQIDKLEDMLSSARSEDFEDRVRSWLEEKRDKYDEVLRRNRELREQEEQLRERLQ